MSAKELAVAKVLMWLGLVSLVTVAVSRAIMAVLLLIGGHCV